MNNSCQNPHLRPLKNKNGFILIFTLGIMSIIFILGISLAVNVKIDEKISLNLKRSMIAEEYARMGITHAINVIEAVYADSDVFSLPQDSISNFTLTNGGYDVTIRDCNSKINLNYCGGINSQAYEEITVANYTTTGVSNFLKPILDVLVDKLEVSGLDTKAAADFVPNYKTKEDLMRFFPGLTSDQRETEFEKIKAYITVHGYVNPYVEGQWGVLDPRAPVNI
ncbi:hypothetical protein IIB34_06565, partial [PVC group bacterium]|nr:hypothetical protein [PVC group bacterium]